MVEVTPINLGTTPDDGTGDTARAGGIKINGNDAALAAAINALNVNQDQILLRLGGGLGPASGHGVAQLIEQSPPAPGHKILAFVGGAIRVIDVAPLLPLPATGEANTGANIATNGVGAFAGKLGVELQFRGVATTTPLGLTVNLDASQNDIDFALIYASQAEAQAGTDNGKMMTALRTAQAIAATVTGVAPAAAQYLALAAHANLTSERILTPQNSVVGVDEGAGAAYRLSLANDSASPGSGMAYGTTGLGSKGYRPAPGLSSDAVVAPVATDDAASGFLKGHIWVDTITGDVLASVKDTASAAVWQHLSPTPPQRVLSNAATFPLQHGLGIDTRIQRNKIIGSHQASVIFQVPADAPDNSEWRLMVTHDGCTAAAVGRTISPNPARLINGGLAIVTVVGSTAQVRGEVVVPATAVTTKTYDADDHGQVFEATGTQTFGPVAANYPLGFWAEIWNANGSSISLTGSDATHTLPANARCVVRRRADGALIAAGATATILDAA